MRFKEDEALHVPRPARLVEADPVVRLSFGGGNFVDLASLHADVTAQLDGLARDMEIPVRYDTASIGLA